MEKEEHAMEFTENASADGIVDSVNKFLESGCKCSRGPNRENVSIFIIYFLEKLLLIFKTATARDRSENFELMHVNVCVLHVVK